MSYPGQAPQQVDAYGRPVWPVVNQRVMRPPLSKTQRNRAFLAGAISNLVLTTGLAIAALCSVLIVIAGAFAFLAMVVPNSDGQGERSFYEALAKTGIASDQGWLVWLLLLGGFAVGLVVCWLGIWIGKIIIAGGSGERAPRPWGVTWSATGILLGTGLLFSGILLPLVGPVLAIVLEVVLGGITTPSGDPGSVVITVASSIITTLLFLALYAVAGALVWWWMAHALRRSPTR